MTDNDLPIHEIVCKLIGPINPIAETREDERRFENLKKVCILAEQLIADIYQISSAYKNRSEFSVKRANEYATKTLDNLGIVP